MKSLAEQMHDGYLAQYSVKAAIEDAFEKYEPEIYDKLEFHIDADHYDNSLEIYFDVSLPYPYEPCKEIRLAALDLGFNIVYWNFMKDNPRDEIRGFEPRRKRTDCLDKVKAIDKEKDDENDNYI